MFNGRGWWLGGVLLVVAAAAAIPNLLRQGVRVGISPWLTGGITIGVFAAVVAVVLIVVLRSNGNARDLVAWARESAPGSSVHMIQATRGLRRMAVAGSDTAPRFWSMAISNDSIVMWSRPQQPPVVVIDRSDVRRAVVHRVDFHTHRVLGLRIELTHSPTAVDFGLCRMRRGMLLNASDADVQRVAAALPLRDGHGAAGQGFPH